MPNLRPLAALVAGLSCASAHADIDPFSCPASLPVMEQTLSAAPDGFRVAVDRPYHKHKLDGFRVHLGPLETADATRYDNSVTTKNKGGGLTETLTWNVSRYEEPYAVCSYTATTLVLVRPLKGYSSCEVKSTSAPSGLLRMQFASCR